MENITALKITIRPANSLDEVTDYFRFAKNGLRLSSDHPRNEDYYAKQFAAAPDLLLGAYDNERLIGVLLGGLETDQVLVGEFYIDPKYQKQSVGSQMLREMEISALRRGIHRIYLGANPKAEGFYLKNNYMPELFIQLREEKSAEKADNIIKLYPGYPVVWRQNAVHDSKIILKTRGLNKKLQSSITRVYPKANIIYLFVKNL